MSLKRVVAVVELLALTAAVAFVVLLFGNEPAAGTSAGAKVYTANCASCHGADGSGGVGPKLAGRVAKRFPNIDDQVAVVRDGRAGMPSFKGRLTPEQIRAVVDYTRTYLGL